MTWRLVRSLDTLRAQVRAAAPLAVPPATPATAWGTVGDLAHQSGTSDHNPTYYPALGSVPVVCAADFPHAPALGLDGGAFTEALRRSRDPRIGYVIFNGRIFSSVNTPWTWRTYTGSDQHRDHWHVSTVHTAIADSTAPWQMPEGTDMELSDTIPDLPGLTVGAFMRDLWTHTVVARGLTLDAAGIPQRHSADRWAQPHYLTTQTRKEAALATEVTALRSIVESLAAAVTAGGGSVDTVAILEGMDAKLAELAAETRDAVADLGEGGATQVRADAD